MADEGGCADPLKHCRTLIEAESEASKDTKEAQAHLDQNVLAGYATVALASMLDPSGGLFPIPYGPVSACSPTLRKRGTRKSRLETKPENDASSTLPVRLWCHLPLQNPANCAENLIRLCSATIGQTGWRMVQFGAIRSRTRFDKNGTFCKTRI